MFDKWPPWLGNVPALGLFITVVGYIFVQWLKNRPAILKLRQDHIASLVQQVAECREECREQERRLKVQIDNLKAQLNNEAWQRVQSEISLVRTMLDVLPVPQMKLVLQALQAKQAGMPRPTEPIVELDGVVGDAQK